MYRLKPQFQASAWIVEINPTLPIKRGHAVGAVLFPYKGPTTQTHYCSALTALSFSLYTHTHTHAWITEI
jgi:hypothetical protein